MPLRLPKFLMRPPAGRAVPGGASNALGMLGARAHAGSKGVVGRSSGASRIVRARSSGGKALRGSMGMVRRHPGKVALGAGAGLGLGAIMRNSGRPVDRVRGRPTGSFMY